MPRGGLPYKAFGSRSKRSSGFSIPEVPRVQQEVGQRLRRAARQRAQIQRKVSRTINRAHRQRDRVLNRLFFD